MSNDISYENGRLVVTRVFNAPREAVFNAWIETSKVELWWGCEDATKVKSEIEPRLGGKYEHLMALKNGGDYPHCGIITEFEPPAFLAYDLVDPFQDEKMTVRVEFIEQGSCTKVRLTQDNLPDAYSEFVMVGWSEGFEKLDRLLIEEAVASTK